MSEKKDYGSDSEIKEPTSGNSINKLILSKFEYDLYNEEDDVVFTTIRVKKFGTTEKQEKWKIFNNDKTMLTIDGSKLSKKERQFLYTVNGINFLISEYKKGIKSFNSLKNELKKQIKG